MFGGLLQHLPHRNDHGGGDSVAVDTQHQRDAGLLGEQYDDNGAVHNGNLNFVSFVNFVIGFDVIDFDRVNVVVLIRNVRFGCLDGQWVIARGERRLSTGRHGAG